MEDSFSRNFLNTAEAAAYLDVSPRTLVNYRNNGWIPFYKPSRKVFFKREDLKAFLENNKFEAYNAPERRYL